MMQSLEMMSKSKLIELVEQQRDIIDELESKLNAVYIYYNITEEDIEQCIKEDV